MVAAPRCSHCFRCLGLKPRLQLSDARGGSRANCFHRPRASSSGILRRLSLARPIVLTGFARGGSMPPSTQPRGMKIAARRPRPGLIHRRRLPGLLRPPRLTCLPGLLRLPRLTRLPGLLLPPRLARLPELLLRLPQPRHQAPTSATLSGVRQVGARGAPSTRGIFPRVSLGRLRGPRRRRLIDRPGIGLELLFTRRRCGQRGTTLTPTAFPGRPRMAGTLTIKHGGCQCGVFGFELPRLMSDQTMERPEVGVWPQRVVLGAFEPPMV